MANSIEGFLFTFGESRTKHIYCLSIFCVLTGRRFAQYKHKGDLVPLRSGLLDTDHRVEDTGRQLVNGKVLYTLRLYDVSDPAKEVLLGAVSPEEIAEWRKSITSVLERPIGATPEPWSPAGGFGRSFSSEALSDNDNNQKHLARTTSPSNLGNGQVHKGLARLVTIGQESPLSTSSADAPGEDEKASSGGSTSKWRLVRCENGLRYFEEIPDTPKWKLPVMKSVGVVKASASQIFDLIMSYGQERSQWDHTIQSSKIVETIDGHSDVVHICLRQDWMWLRPRDLCISRYWKREENGAYAVFYRSLPKFPIQTCHVRALINSGGYIVTPLKASSSGKPRSLVEYVLEMDMTGCTSWMSMGRSAYPAYLRDTLLSTVAGIRDYYAAQRVDSTVTIVKRHIVVFEEDCSSPRHPSESINDVPFLDSDDLEEFYDATMDQLSDVSEGTVDTCEFVVEATHAKSSHKRDDLPDVDWSIFKGNVPVGPQEGGKHCYSQPNSSAFKIKGPNYLLNGALVPAGEPLCKLVTVDWYKGKERMDHIAGRPQNLVQKAAGKDVFFFVVNLQVPQSSQMSLVFYFATQNMIAEGSLLQRFIKGDDTFRNSRLTLIPAIAEGSWIIKQAVGSRAVTMAQILETTYHNGPNYIEVDVNLGSSGVVRGVLGLVFGYITALVVDMAFLIRGDTEEELPEHLLGVVRCSRLDIDKAKFL
ncbi:hypothetical protein MPTK1_1g18020 [Marchantia polymorpha subsp. ruderalis]|uniref:START domain-containing protein n=2 Tax=Marchantia polymorpha TaxID=3197 RepID=A0AAF6ARE4_MARPO|nr:hypothetical protein MARPO_0001s0140 [Marchantia polymorpha]BBM99014.1 hypothetical protein Mp_1g18020 [Marchantia polymorpha subsp. ruderalis]|eukprot:PTQ50089.1 hypothetical protein MARPO_0001s0140 [Marchantia polymorpha]